MAGKLMRSILALCMAFGVALSASSAVAEKRLALVIGNDTYEHVTPLKKATADAKAYRDHFENEREFDQVFFAENADEETMVETIASFISAINEGDVAVVVYSGHGVQLDQNRSDSLFLLPTDIPELDGSGLSAEFRLSRSAISFSELRTQISLRGAATRVFVLDACRDNPFTSDDGTRSVGNTRGLLPIKTVSGEFVFFAAAPGARALDRLSNDDPDPNSVFSRIFLQHFRKGAFLEDIANDVQRDVFDLAKTASPSFIQQPYYDDGVIGRTCIDDACGQAAVNNTGPSPTGPVVSSAQCDRALARELWDFARETNDCLGYGAFLEACPQSTFAAFARAGRARLGCEAVASIAPGAGPKPARPRAPEASAGSGGPVIAAAPAAPAGESRNEEAAALEAPVEDKAEADVAAEPEQRRPSKYEARREILSALSELYKAGVETQYDALRIDETASGIEARLENLRARFPDLDVEISLAEISARRDEAGGVIFTLPERIVLEDLTPIEGAAETAEMIISSKSLFAGLYRDEEDGHVLRVGAARLKLEPPDQSGESIAFTDLAVDGRLWSNAETGDASLAASITVSEATADLSDGSDPIKMRAQDLLFRFDGDRDQAKGVFGVKSAGFSGADFGNVGLGGLQFSLDAKPGDQFDFSAALAPEASTEDVISAVVATVYQKVLEGGHIDTSAALAQLSGNVGPNGPSGPDATSFDARGLGAKLELNPYRIGAGLEAKTFTFDGQMPEPVAFSFDNMRADFAAEPGNRFDWSGVAAAPGDQEASSAMFDQIRHEIAAGGRASFILTNDGYRASSPIPAIGIGPFTALTTGSAGNSTELTFEQDIARLAMNASAFYYETQGEIAGRADIGGFGLDAAFPLTAAQERQEGRAALSLDEITLDDSLWAQIDPKNVLNHKIGGVSLQTIILTTIMKDLLTLDGSEVDAPLTVHQVSLSKLSVDALGAQLSAVGDIMIDPTPVGVVTATISGWRQMFSGLGQTPMATDPDLAGMLLAATSWIDSYGVAGAGPDETILKIEFSDTGQVTINGKPFEG